MSADLAFQTLNLHQEVLKIISVHRARITPTTHQNQLEKYITIYSRVNVFIQKIVMHTSCRTEHFFCGTNIEGSIIGNTKLFKLDGVNVIEIAGQSAVVEKSLQILIEHH